MRLSVETSLRLNWIEDDELHLSGYWSWLFLKVTHANTSLLRAGLCPALLQDSYVKKTNGGGGKQTTFPWLRSANCVNKNIPPLLFVFFNISTEGWQPGSAYLRPLMAVEGAPVAQSVGYGLDGRCSIPGKDRDFYSFLQTGSGAHPASYSVGTW